jgi:type II/III secretion system protein
MVGRHIISAALFGLLLLTAPALGQNHLLKKFKQQNESAVEKLKIDVITNLAHAQSPSRNVDKSLEALSKNLIELQEDALLPKEERARLLQSVQGRLDELRSVVAAERKRQEALKPKVQIARPDDNQPAGKMGFIGPGDLPSQQGNLKVGQVFGQQPVPVGGQLGPITPAVSADRMFVRVGINGTFFAPRFNYVPFQFAIPSVYYGPGKGFTIGQPEKVFQVFLPQVAAMTVLGLNTTVNVPDGGAVVAGGSTYSAESRSEFGVPVLSHVPYLGRLFRNTSYGRESGSTRVIVAPRIISLEEEEQKLLGNR